MKRIFAAVKIEPGKKFIKSFRELRSRLSSEPIKWVEEHNIHITIKFFGETNELLIPAISGTIGKIAKNCREFNFRLSGIGLFGSRYQPRVVWVGIVPYEPLALLMKTMQLEMEQHGFKSDQQNIVPHLTLGRIKFLKDKTLFQKVIEANREIQSDPMKISEIILFESVLLKEGPQYISLVRFPFAQ
ncbi:MAG: RNA 2',3'-cyclic phosphodiesterase [Bacteroidetes bacterium]|nr:RNA 2',3'-cyclic phosphodiesterase [Bacteroidota bacterium]